MDPSLEFSDEFFNSWTRDQLRELLLGLRAVLEKSQGTVASLNGKIEKLNKEVRHLHKAHKRNVEKLNSFIAAHGMKGTPRAKRSGCMPLRTIDLTLDEDDEEMGTAAGSAEVAQAADHASLPLI